jgi:serine/threonine-protein kinase
MRSGSQWSRWFTADLTGFELDDLEPAAWRRTPPDACDEVQAWEGTRPHTGEKLYVEAAAYRGRPVYFQVLNSIAVEGGGSQPQVWGWQFDALLYLLIVIHLGGVALAWRNVQLGRCDRRGALRLAVFSFAVLLLIWVLVANHLSGAYEWPLMVIGLATVLFGTAQLWLLYVALEPFVRRIWPQTLTSWTRVLGGRWRDARVGSDLLLGVASGVLAYLAVNAGVLGSTWLNLETGLIEARTWSNRGGAEFAVQLLDALRFAIFAGLIFLTLLLILRIVLRSEQLAAIGFVVIVAALHTFVFPGHPAVSWLPILLHRILLVWLLTRFGLLAVITTVAVSGLLWNNPFTMDSESMFFTDGVLAIGVVVALALYGAYHTLAGRALFRNVETNPV